MREQLVLIDVPRIPSEWDEREAYYSRPEYVRPLCDYLAECSATDPEIRLLLACGGAIVEPCVGGGAIVDGLVQCWGSADIERDIITGAGDSTDYEWMIWGSDKQGPRGGHHELRPWKETFRV